MSFQQVNGGDFTLPPAFDMKAFKAEILKEMRSEITKAKNEIIDGEFSRKKNEEYSSVYNVTSFFCVIQQKNE